MTFLASTPHRFILLLSIMFMSACSPSEDFSHLEGDDSNRRFTVASYNVENLFDQVDNGINQYYNAYRIRKNSNGYFSNYGAKIRFENKMQTFTQVKIAGVIKNLQSIKDNGPEIACFQEVENDNVMRLLFEAAKPLGYTDFAVSDFSDHGGSKQSINLGCLSKFEITDVRPVFVDSEVRQRPIMVMTVDVRGHPFTVVNNHWRSKAAAESARLDSGLALAEEILSWDLDHDYTIVGDLNSAYNEDKVISRAHNDTNGVTGINDALKALGDEDEVASGDDPELHYNLNYELPSRKRVTAYHGSWSSLDHMIVGTSSYDGSGIDYVDSSFQIVNADTPRFTHLFRSSGTPIRWSMRRVGGREYRHATGGYSDHMPLYADFEIQ